MSTKISKDLSEDTAFDFLAKEIDKPTQPVDLQSKVLTFQVKRSAKRDIIQGTASICDSAKKILSNARFKNLSPSGVSFEILPVDIKIGLDVYVHFSNSINLGLVPCTVQWITPIEGHRNNHILIGLKFKSLTAIQDKTLNEFLTKLKISRSRDPFY